jgi:Autographiviridae endonuclease
MDRFWSKVDKSGDCWNWTGTIKKNGYGHFRDGSEKIGAHRFAWMLVHGPIPPGMFVCHRCDNRRCVRLEHLFLGSPKDNTQDMIAKGRKSTEVARGERSGTAVLTNRDVVYIRGLSKIGFTNRELGKMYKVDPSCISRINRGLAWGHILAAAHQGDKPSS